MGPDQEFTDEIKKYVHSAFIIDDALSYKIHPELSDVNFRILLLTDSYEFLIGAKNKVEDFEIYVKKDEVLNKKIVYRKRTYSKNFLATFPIIDGLPTIVIGTPRNTGLSPSAWIVTILHEHFHQWQMGHPQYISNSLKLNLHDKDESGMWMLNYPFPYQEKNVNDLIVQLSQALIDRDPVSEIKEILQMIYETVGKKNYSYLMFQLWQEGIAKYVEGRYLALLLSQENWSPSSDGKLNNSLLDYANEFNIQQNKVVLSQSLKEEKRGTFYALGWAFGNYLRNRDKDWMSSYFDHFFDLGVFLND